MKCITSEGWPRERLLVLIRELYNTIDHMEYNYHDGEQSEVALIEFRSDLCLTSMKETFVVCDISNELPAEFVAEVNFKEDTIRVLP